MNGLCFPLQADAADKELERVSDVPSKINDYVVDAVVESLGHADYQRKFERIEEPDDADLSKIPLVALMGFTGEKVSGHMVFACSAEFLRLTNPIKDVPSGKEDAYARDWLGEILNIVVGQFKRKMANHGFSFTVTTPSFQHYVRTSAMTLEEYGPARYGDDGAFQDYWFQLGKLYVAFQIGLKLMAPLQ
jgi:CheY-specific phosphatase CheX